ncbi:MAG: hypothetical protein AB1393_13865 [Candidatus Edwardsbacteria bacterium]
MAIVFDYRRERINGETIYRPVANVILISGINRVLIYPYIDAGADLTLLPRSIGEALNLRISHLPIEELSGVGEGKVPVIKKRLKMKISDEIFEAEIAWALIEEVPPLLGRKNVFEHFEITFKEWDRKVIFVPSSKR